jgi:hypothetical protein
MFDRLGANHTARRTVENTWGSLSETAVPVCDIRDRVGP